MSPIASTSPPGNRATSRSRLEATIEYIGHLLPAQGPLDVFVHHNTLHAFEHLLFEDAVERAASLYGCEPYLSEAYYRDALHQGRIEDADLGAVLQESMGDGSCHHSVIENITRLELRKRILRDGVDELSGKTLAWTLTETDALRAFRPRASASTESQDTVQALWRACEGAIARAGKLDDKPSAQTPTVRHRDLLLTTAQLDVDEWVHALLIRFVSTFLDQGLADWAMPGRERGMYTCFVDLYKRRLARLCRPFGTDLQRVVGDDYSATRDAWDSLASSLTDLGVPDSEWQTFLLAETLTLRGFAGMVRQHERQHERQHDHGSPTDAQPQAMLCDLIAIKLLLLRASLAHAARQLGFRGAAPQFRDWLSSRDSRSTTQAQAVETRAWRLFQVAQLFALDAHAVDALDSDAVTALEQELITFHPVARRRAFHQAYERRLRNRYYDALALHRPKDTHPPAFQALFCVDDREESIRRHLEEIDAEVETFGVAGFFGVAMYYRGQKEARARALCPVAVVPTHIVTEEPACVASEPVGLRKLWKGARVFLERNLHESSRFGRAGAVVFTTIGVLWAVPLVARVVFPWWTRSAKRLYARTVDNAGRLALETTTNEEIHDHTFREQSLQHGFSVEEMADIVGGQLIPIGIANRLAPLVLVFGHGATGLNNPHQPAYNCGACGGGRGGPNARAFAEMANHPGVRTLLAARGLVIPDDTWFVGGERNTTTNDIILYDEGRVPETLRGLLARARRCLDEARAREAHERCRRFESADLGLSPEAALRHVQTRGSDLAQPRPELGHATNAFCFVGRRSCTRGLFLDRRAFLVSYDPSADVEGQVLSKSLAAVVPVVAGINLEYLFSRIDGVGYGAGTKLPHNVVGLFGVMDGAKSDLRTGLPWQMVEAHEPVRLSLVVETEPDILREVLERDTYLKTLVDHRWIFLAALSPSRKNLFEVNTHGAEIYVPGATLETCRGDSRAHYKYRREHLPFVALEMFQGGAS